MESRDLEIAATIVFALSASNTIVPSQPIEIIKLHDYLYECDLVTSFGKITVSVSTNERE